MGAVGLVTVLTFTGAQVKAAFDGGPPSDWPETPDIVVFNTSTATDSGGIPQTTLNMVTGGEIEVGRHAVETDFLAGWFRTS